MASSPLRSSASSLSPSSGSSSTGSSSSSSGSSSSTSTSAASSRSSSPKNSHSRSASPMVEGGSRLAASNNDKGEEDEDHESELNHRTKHGRSNNDRNSVVTEPEIVTAPGAPFMSKEEWNEFYTAFKRSTMENSDEITTSESSSQIIDKIGSDIAQLIIDECVEEIVLGISFEVHRAGKLGFLFIDEFGPEEQKRYEIVEGPNVDIFGNLITTKVQFECECPKCGRTLAAQRFAPHLEKCIGKGRNSSRIASRRIAKNIANKSADCKDSDMEDCDNHNDGDWNFGSSRTKTARGRATSKGRRSKAAVSKKNPSLPFNLVNDNPGSVGSSNGSEGSGSYTFESLSIMDINERRSILSYMCCVVSEHTKKCCAKSLRCPQHTDDQRHNLRQLLLPEDYASAVVGGPDISGLISGSVGKAKSTTGSRAGSSCSNSEASSPYLPSLSSSSYSNHPTIINDIERDHKRDNLNVLNSIGASPSPSPSSPSSLHNHHQGATKTSSSSDSHPYRLPISREASPSPDSLLRTSSPSSGKRKNTLLIKVTYPNSTKPSSGELAGEGSSKEGKNGTVNKKKAKYSIVQRTPEEEEQDRQDAAAEGNGQIHLQVPQSDIYDGENHRKATSGRSSVSPSGRRTGSQPQSQSGSARGAASRAVSPSSADSMTGAGTSDPSSQSVKSKNLIKASSSSASSTSSDYNQRSSKTIKNNHNHRLNDKSDVNHDIHGRDINSNSHDTQR